MLQLSICFLKRNNKSKIWYLFFFLCHIFVVANGKSHVCTVILQLIQPCKIIYKLIVYVIHSELQLLLLSLISVILYMCCYHWSFLHCTESSFLYRLTPDSLGLASALESSWWLPKSKVCWQTWQINIFNQRFFWYATLSCINVLSYDTTRHYV